MKHWRVGSLSMGLLLVATGIMMLVSLVIRVNVLDVLLTFWPLILICLGIETLNSKRYIMEEICADFCLAANKKGPYHTGNKSAYLSSRTSALSDYATICQWSVLGINGIIISANDTFNH